MTIPSWARVAHLLNADGGRMSDVPDISPPSNLKPALKTFEGVADKLVNADGVIEIMRQTDTPQAKAIYRSFRRIYALARQRGHLMSDEKVRAQSLMQAIEEQGHEIKLTNIDSQPKEQNWSVGDGGQRDD